MSLKIPSGHSMILARKEPPENRGMFITKMAMQMFGENDSDGLFEFGLAWCRTQTEVARESTRPLRWPINGVAALMAMVLGFCGGAKAQGREPSTSLLNATRAIAVNTKTGKVYAVAGARGAVTVFEDGKKATRSVAVGKDPVALCCERSYQSDLRGE